MERKDKADKDKGYKAAQRETKKNLKDVTQGEDGEMAVRKHQHNRDQKWKETGRNQIKKNTNFDMARSLFGGGGPAPDGDEYEEEEEEEEDVEEVVEEVVEQVEQLAVDDDEEEEEEDEEEEEYVEEYVEEEEEAEEPSDEE